MSTSSKKKNFVKKAGWLEKKGDKGPVKIWRLRYFVETEKGTVQYFTTNDLTQDTYRGQIDLHDVLSVSKSIEVDVTQSEQNKLEFNVLVKSGRIYRLRVDTQEERKQWMTIFGSKLLRAREQQQRPIPATTAPADPQQNFNTFDFHAHTMPAYVMKQLFEESQHSNEHPKLERSQSAENARLHVVTTPHNPYGKLSAAPIIVDLTTTNNNNNVPHSYGLMPTPETIRNLKHQQSLSSLKDGYLHLIQHDPDKFLHVTNKGQQAPPTSAPTTYARLSKYNLESSTSYQANSRQSIDFARQSGLAMTKNDEKELERLEKLLMVEEARGSGYGQPMSSFLKEEQPVNQSATQHKPPADDNKPETNHENSITPNKRYEYGSLSAVSARLEEKENQKLQNSNYNLSPNTLQHTPKTNRRSNPDLYQPIPSSLSPPQTPLALAEEKKERSATAESQVAANSKNSPEYGCLPSVRKSQLSPQVTAMLENSYSSPNSSPQKSPTKQPINREQKVQVSKSDILYSSQEVDPCYLQMPTYVNQPTQ